MPYAINRPLVFALLASGLLAIAFVFFPMLQAQVPSGNGGWLTIDNPVSIHSVTNGQLAIDGRGGGLHVWTDVCAEDINGNPTEFIWARSQLINPVNYRINLEGTGEQRQTGTFNLTQIAGEEVTGNECGNADEGTNFRYTFAFSVDVSTLGPGLYRFTAETGDNVLGNIVTDSFLFEIDSPVEPLPQLTSSEQTASLQWRSSNDQGGPHAFQVFNDGHQGSVMSYVARESVPWIKILEGATGENLGSGDSQVLRFEIDLQGQVGFRGAPETNDWSIFLDCINQLNELSGCAGEDPVVVDVPYLIPSVEVDLRAIPVN